ncbi:DUF58 [Candidatus Magnetomoraceae bacterium gMMP-15]
MIKFFPLTKKLIFGTKDYVLLPQTLNRQNIFILPNKYGIIYMFVLFLMLMASVNYHNNLAFLLTFLLGSMVFISILHTYRNISGIRFVFFRTKPVFTGDDAVFKFIIRINDFNRAAIELSFIKEKKIIYNLLINKDNQVKVSIAAEKRGILKPGRLVVSTCYPFGLFRAWSTLYFNLECTVYPKPISGSLQQSNGLSQNTEGESQAKISGTDDFEGLRTYIPGDSLKHISWKTFSKGQGLFTKEFIGQSGSSVFLDWDKIKHTDIEYKLSLLCHNILNAERLNMTYGLKLPGNAIEPGSGEIHKHNCLKALALFGLLENKS